MAALLRSQDGFDLETAIREWQSRQNERQHGGPAPEPDEKSAVARLTAALDTLFRETVVILSDKGKFPRDIFISLDRSRSCFSLWSHGHGVASGSLDDSFQRSGKLRHATIKTLSHLSTTLIDGLLPVARVSNSKTEGLCDQVNNILEEIKFSHVADDSSSDSTSEYSTADVHELAEDLKTDVDCLIELDQIIRDPAADPEPEMTEADVSLSLWAPHQVSANKIEHRFPEADTKLISSLGMVNYQRYLRCRIERDHNQVHAEHPEQAVEVTTGSKFHDSGLGSSLNPASSYAETIMNYGDGNRSIRIPPLPEEAKRGEPFPCAACGRSVIITTNSQWKRHLYIDLQPYVCLDTSCQRSDSTFSNRANWLQHLALDHGMEPKWEQIECPLCGDEAGPGKTAITTHLGRHLEEISLSALPAAPDSETNSETSGLDVEHNDQEHQDSEDKLQDLQAVPVESERELQEQQPTLSHQTVDASIYSILGRPTEREGKAASPLRIQGYEPQMPNNDRGLVPSEASVDSWKTWEDLVHAATKEAAGDDAPIFSDYPASSSVRPTSGDAVLVQYPKHGRDPDVQIHNGKEAAFYRRMGKMQPSQEEAKKEVGKARAEAEEASRERLEAERKAERKAEEGARKHIEAIIARNKAEMKAAKERAERAAEEGFKAEENFKADMELIRQRLKIQEGIMRQQEEVDRAASVERGQRLDDWQKRRWRRICPSCGSEDQDRRKGPICSNCSYLVGDGDGFETDVPEQHRPPPELSFLEPSIGIDSHTAALKKKLNPIRLSTAANRPLSDPYPPVLPPIQLGNTKGIRTTVRSLSEDPDLVEGFRDHDRDWSLITDEAEQRRRANRMVQRGLRSQLRKRIEDLEKRAAAADGRDSSQSGTSTEGPLNDIPNSPTQRKFGSAHDQDRDSDGDRDTRHHTPSPPRANQDSLNALVWNRTILGTSEYPIDVDRLPSPTDSESEAIGQILSQDARFDSVRNDGDDLEDES